VNIELGIVHSIIEHAKIMHNFVTYVFYAFSIKLKVTRVLRNLSYAEQLSHNEVSP